MEYRSPIRLISHAAEPVETFSVQVLNRTRKKILAEMALQNDELQLENISYTKNDVIGLLNGMTSEELWKFHCIIYAYPALLAFLEEGVFDTLEFKEFHTLLLPGNEDFVAFVSPYFALSFNEMAGTLIRLEEFATLSDLMNYQGFILPEHAHEGFQKIRIYLDELVHMLKNLSWEKFQRDESILHFLFSEDWISLMNQLPGTFSGVRDELVIHILNVVFRFQKKASWKYLYQLCASIQGLECGQFQRSEIDRFRRVMAQNASIKRSVGSKGKSIARSAFWILWIVMAIVRAGGGFDSHQDSLFNTEQAGVLVNAVRVPENVSNLKRYLNQMSQTDTIRADIQPLHTGDIPFTAFSQLPLSTWPDTLFINNQSGFDCALLYFEDPKNGIYPRNGMMPAMYSVYIAKGSVYRMKVDPERGRFNFIFGDQWGQLRETHKFVPASQVAADNFSTDNNLYLYNWFVNKKPLTQYYLQHDIVIDHPQTAVDTSAYKKLNRSAVLQKATYCEATTLTLGRKDSQFTISASGALQVLEAKAVSFPK